MKLYVASLIVTKELPDRLQGDALKTNLLPGAIYNQHVLHMM